MKIQHCTAVLALLICLSWLPARAQDARLYGLDINLVKSELWRMDLPDGEFEVVADLIGRLTTVQKITIDTRNDLLCVLCTVTLPAHDCFQAFDLNTGELRSEVERLSPTTLGMEYNPLDGRLYFLELHDNSFDVWQWCLSSIDPATGELNRMEPFIGRKLGGFDYVRLDYERGVLWNFSNASDVWVGVDIRTGKAIQWPEPGFTLRAAEYFEGTGTFLGLRSERRNNVNVYDLVEFNPDEGTVSTVRTGIMDDRNPDGNSNSDIDPVEGRYYVGTDAGTVEVYTLTGQRIDRIEDWEVRYGSRWALHRKYAPVNKLARVYGTVNADQLNNCDIAGSTPLMTGIEINFEPGGYRAWSAEDGKFLTFLPVDATYTADFHNNDLWNIPCQDNPSEFVVSAEGEADRHLDYLLQSNRIFERTEVSLVAGRAILARDLTYTIQLSNAGTLLFNGTLVLCFDPRLTDIRADPAPDRVFDGVAEWDIVNMPIGALRQFNITFQIPADESLRGVELCAQAKIRDKKQLDLLNKFGRDEMCVTVRASLDPNDISVAPRGFGERGMIATEDSTLAYTIRFQNIGDAPARDVVILDTLDEDLDVNTLHFGAASHDYTVSLFNGRILEFRFEGIELPGAQQDEAGSHGMVKYKVDLNKDAGIGTEIENRAGIYFDFNAPVITNTVVNTITDLSTDVDTAPQQPGLELRSPSNGLFVLHRVNNAAATIQVYSVLGVKVHEARLQPGGEAQIDLRRLPGGRYLIRVESRGESIVRSVAVVK